MSKKAQIRVEMLTKRLKQLPVIKKQRDVKIIETIESMKKFKEAQNVLFYMPIHGEIDLSELFKKNKDNKNFILPRVLKKKFELTLYKITSFDDLEEGNFRISEPKTNLEKIEPSMLDFIILPGIAFSIDGHRIGYGQGYFDRLLKKTDCLKIGVAYEFQIVKNSLGEDHDVPVEKIITESRVIDIQTS